MLILLAAQQGRESNRQGRDKPADQGDGRLTSQNNHPVWVWMPGSFIEPKREAMRNHSQKAE